MRDMKVTIKIPGENQNLVDSLGGKGISAKLVRGGVLISPDYDAGAGGYVIPKEVNGRKRLFLIDCHEYGGAMTHTGDATVVCSYRGLRLRPYYRPQKGHLANGIHAYFSIPNVVITVTAHRNDTNISISSHRIMVEDGVVDIDSKVMWSGEVDFLPEKFGCYANAVAAASEKSECYHCREAHYVEKVVEH